MKCVVSVSEDDLTHSRVNYLYTKLGIRLYNFLDKYNVPLASQYGFLQQISTEHATLKLIDSVVEALNDNRHALAVFIDLSEAFSTSHHNICFDIVWHFGIRGFPHKPLFKFTLHIESSS